MSPTSCHPAPGRAGHGCGPARRPRRRPAPLAITRLDNRTRLKVPAPVGDRARWHYLQVSYLCLGLGPAMAFEPQPTTTRCPRSGTKPAPPATWRRSFPTPGAVPRYVVRAPDPPTRPSLPPGPVPRRDLATYGGGRRFSGARMRSKSKLRSCIQPWGKTDLCADHISRRPS